jgi:FkbM family methyltransferase
MSSGVVAVGIKALARRVLRSLGVEVSRYRGERQPTIGDLDAAFFRRLRSLRDLPSIDPATEFIKLCLRHQGDSRAQLFQDVLALYLFQGKRGGFFVEFGAADGKIVSNTYLLERSYGWRGILAEPARIWHDDLLKNRRCAVDTRCVWTTTGDSMSFSESRSPEYSTIATFKETDYHAHARADSTEYAVETVSLNDLLAHHKAPAEIDYMSIDTEGSELSILSAFDFSRHTIRLITVEHNHSLQRAAINDLLRAHGFRQIFPDLSDFDDWFVSPPPKPAP